MPDQNYNHCGEYWKSLLEYLIMKTASVHYRVKPAVLLRLSNCRRLKEQGHYDSFCRHERELMEKLKLKCLILRGSPADLQILFYDRSLLEKQLMRAENRAFLTEQGYRDGSSVEEYLAELKQRFECSGVPHEIGIFLGYPLKDVRGFIAGAEKGTIISGVRWRVFGDPEESMKVMTHCRRAEELMRRRVNNQTSQGGILWQR